MNKKLLAITLLSLIFMQLTSIGLASHSDDNSDETDENSENDSSLKPNGAYTGVEGTKKLFPLGPSEIVGIFILVLVSGLANAGGMGGGTLMTSILIMFFYYTENTALTVVYTLVFGGSLGNYMNVARRRDRKTGKPLVDYDLAMICMPPMVLGTNVGVILGRVSAPIVILLGIIGVTIFTSTKVLKRAKKQYAQETREIENSEPLMSPRLHSDVEWREKWMESFQSSSECIVDPKVQRILNEEQKLFPPRKLAILMGLLLTCMIFAIFRGTSRMESPIGVTYCQVGYWTIFFLGLGICTLVLLINQRLVRHHIKLKKDHDIDTTVGEFQISGENIPKLILLSITAGVLAGLLGMGGGMVMNPTLLMLGIPPQNLAATTGFFVVQTSFISLFQASLYGDVPVFEQGFFFIVSLIGSFGVSYFLSWMVKKYRRPSLILFALVIVLSISLVATPAFEFYENIKNIKHLVKFKPIC